MPCHNSLSLASAERWLLPELFNQRKGSSTRSCKHPLTNFWPRRSQFRWLDTAASPAAKWFASRSTAALTRMHPCLCFQSEIDGGLVGSPPVVRGNSMRRDTRIRLSAKPLRRPFGGVIVSCIIPTSGRLPRSHRHDARLCHGCCSFLWFYAKFNCSPMCSRPA